MAYRNHQNYRARRGINFASDQRPVRREVPQIPSATSQRKLAGPYTPPPAPVAPQTRKQWRQKMRQTAALLARRCNVSISEVLAADDPRRLVHPQRARWRVMNLANKLLRLRAMSFASTAVG
jgi:hypothetical protein